MKRPVTVGAMAMMFALGMVLAVFVAGSAAAKSPKSKSTTKSTPKSTTTSAPLPSYTTTTSSPGDSFFVINGTVNAASDHEIVGSSAFPNFTTGAVDNYYAMAHSHLDNSPFAEGTASPADTGPVGQTAAAGNFQQPQYADARWPGDKDSGKATFGTQGQPYATAEAGEFRATADASEATNGLSGPGPDGKKTLALPNGFDLKLRQALAGWKGKWQVPLGLKKPASPVKRPALPVKPPTTVPVKPPTATVKTPVATVTTPGAGVGGVTTPPVPVPVPSTSVPPTPVPPPPVPSPAALRTPSRSLASASSSSPPGDGESLLTSSTQASLVPAAARPKTATTTTTDSTTTTSTTKTKTKAPKTTTTQADKKNYALALSGESSVGRVSLGGGQIVIEGIHVTASITNDGTPSYKANVSIASATIGGVPVTIDQDGVHVAGQGQGLPYQQASDALNGALKQAGIQLFLVAPEVTTGSCGDQSGSGMPGSGTGGGMTTTTTSSSDQSGTAGSTDSCGGGQTGTCDSSASDSGSGSGAPSVPGLPGSPTSTDQTDTTTAPSCGQMCDSGSGTSTSSGTTTTTTATTTSRGVTTPTQTGTTSTNSAYQSSGNTTTSSCGGTSLPSTTGSCAQPGTAGGTTTTMSDQAGTTTTGSNGLFSLGGGSSNSGEEIVTATGLHVVFTQPVNQSGVPAQYVEHILGEVFVDSLAVPASDSPGLDSSSLGSFGSFGSSSSSPSGSSPSCLGGGAGGAASGSSASGVGGSSSGVAGSSGSLSSTGSASQPTAGSTGGSLPAMFAAALRKPLWLLLAYVLWQAIVIGTGASLWNWRRGGAS